MRKFCLVMIAVAALMVAGSSNNAFAANVTTGQSVVSPYWQADANSIYTFIAVSVPSIANAVSRAVTVTAVQAGSVSQTGIDAGAGIIAGTLTIAVGNTAKFFIANTGHSSVNSNSVTGANWISVTGSGHVVIAASNPVGPATVGTGLNYASALNVWGAVVIPESGTGFAMEFIGDLGDSLGVISVDGSTIGPQGDI